MYAYHLLSIVNIQTMTGWPAVRSDAPIHHPPPNITLTDPLQWLLRRGTGASDVEGLRATVKGLEQELGRLRVQHGG